MTLPLLPEYALLLDAVAPLRSARAEHRGWDDERWARALRIADWHRLSPILFCHLEREGKAPAPVIDALERAYLANAARALFIAASLRKVLDALAAAEVPAILLKGAALVETVYPDPAQREMLDLDILVPPEQVDAASAALAALGYQALPSTAGAGPTGTHLRVSAHHDAALVDGEQVVAVELHRHIAIADEAKAFDIDGVWERARSSSRGAHLLPSVEDLLLHVCFHFTRNRLGGSYRRRHTGGALAQICDIARIIESEQIDWTALVATARRYGLGARVFLALFAARELGVPVPETALAELRPTGMDHDVGRRLVSLRVLQAGEQLPVRSVRWMLAPGREALRRGWNADAAEPLSLAIAYARRARAQAPLLGSALRRPWNVVQDRRLNSQIYATEDHG